MRFRAWRNAWPTLWYESCCLLFICLSILAVAVFELWLILPELCKVGSFAFYCNLLLAFFIIFNCCGNLLLCILVDTSFGKASLPAPPELESWHYCERCQLLVPPRTWHCKDCGVCILKRDHHCLFTGCCIGYHNHRFFIYFLAYLHIGVSVALVYNTLYIWQVRHKIIQFPYMILGWTLPNVKRWPKDCWWFAEICGIYKLNLFIWCITFGSLLFYFWKVLRGCEPHISNSRKYDLGRRRNLRLVFGRRTHLSWLSPFLSSEMPHDGLQWESSA